MTIEKTLVQANDKGEFKLQITRAEVSTVDFSDIDLLIVAKDGVHYVLPEVAMEAMGDTPPVVIFSDGSVVSANDLFSLVESFNTSNLNTLTLSSQENTFSKNEYDDKVEELRVVQSDLDTAQEKLDQIEEKVKAYEAQVAQMEVQNKQLEEKVDSIEKTDEEVQAQDQNNNEMKALAVEHELTEEFQERIENIIEQLHNKDYDYVPPKEYQPPSAPFAGPAGVPAPISMTPLVTLTMGNVVGTETDITSIPGTTISYGGGGAVGSDASSKLGPRDPAQFSTAIITGTSGDDIVYAEGTLLGNTDPSTDTSNYAKSFSLRVAGYFTELDDIVLRGLPDFVSVTGATKQVDGSWALPSAIVIAQESFELIYNKDAWRGGSDLIDMTVEVSGMMRNESFTSSELFRLQFVDVKDVGEVTDPYLTYWDDGQNKQLYILQTQDQPNDINTGDGNDKVYGGRSHDIIDVGSGDDIVVAYGGNNVVTGGTGNDTITTGADNDTIYGGADNDTIDAGDGVNIIDGGDGLNQITTGSGDDTITSGVDKDIIDAGDGTNIISAGDGDNEITTGSGVDTITAGDGANIVDAGDGSDVITLGDGGSTVTAGAGNDTVITGAGDDNISGNDGDDILHGGLGTNILSGGAGSNRADYTGLSVGVTASLLAGTATATGLSDTYTDIQGLVGTDQADTLIGNTSSNYIHGSGGDDIITGGGGNDTILGGDGLDVITGGAGDDRIEGGAGADTIDGGGSGTDVLYGNDGNDIFINPSIGVSYNGGDGVDKVDYSSYTGNLIVDLGEGVGYTGPSQLASYTSIEWIVGGTGGDTLTGGSGDDVLDGGSGNDTLDGGAGNNTLIGGTGSNYYNMGVGHDYIDANASAWNEVRYNNSPAAVVINLDVVELSFINNNGVSIIVGAGSGASRKETDADNASWSIGDTYSNGIDYIQGSNYADVMFGSDAADRFYGRGGDDVLFMGGGDDTPYLSWGDDRIDGGDGVDRLYLVTGSDITAYLDGTADLNGNGIADYLDKGITDLEGYTGFATGWGSGKNLLTNIENLIGAGGSDTLVGNSASNELNGQGGSNKLFGLGGDDLIFSNRGANTIDGGDGVDCVSFRSEGQTGSWGYRSTVSAEIYLQDTDLDGDGLLDVANSWGLYSGFHARTTEDGSTYNYSLIYDVENITGTQNNDKIAGDSGNNIIYGYSGNDVITGNGGVDSLYGENGNDTFVVDSGDLTDITLVNGGSGTDTLRSSGWTFAANSIYSDNSKYSSLEELDVRNNSSGDTYDMTAYDIRSLVDLGSSSVIDCYLDSGDTYSFTVGSGTGALSCLQTTDTADLDVYKYYSDAGHVTDNSTNLTAIINVHFGA